jgi:hypothetical protein
MYIKGGLKPEENKCQDATYSTYGSASACCKAGPSSDPGRINVLYECDGIKV